MSLLKIVEIFDVLFVQDGTMRFSINAVREKKKPFSECSESIKPELRVIETDLLIFPFCFLNFRGQ